MKKLSFNEYIGVTLEEFVESNMNLAYSVANKYRKKAFNSMDDPEDYEQICFLGLIRSYLEYKPIEGKSGKVGKPTTYAVSKMKGMLSDHFRDKSRIIKYPRDFYKVWNQVRSLGLSNEDDLHYVADQINMDYKIVEEAMLYYDHQQPLSLDAPTEHDSDDKVEDFINNFFLEEDFSIIYINEFVDTLDDFEKQVLSMFVSGMNVNEIRHKLNFSHRKVSSALKRIENKLHDYYRLAKEGF